MCANFLFLTMLSITSSVIYWRTDMRQHGVYFLIISCMISAHTLLWHLFIHSGCRLPNKVKLSYFYNAFEGDLLFFPPFCKWAIILSFKWCLNISQNTKGQTKTKFYLSQHINTLSNRKMMRRKKFGNTVWFDTKILNPKLYEMY